MSGTSLITDAVAPRVIRSRKHRSTMKLHDGARSTALLHVEVPQQIECRLRQLALERDVAVEEVMMDGILLVLRYYGHAEGMPEPTRKGGAA